MIRSSVFPFRTSVPLFAFSFSAALLLAGCAHMSGPPAAAPAVALAPDPSGYAWAGESLTATGRASAPGSTAGPQRVLVARNAARVAAIKDLKAQVRELPAGPDGKLGVIMDKYLAVRRAVEKELQQAQIVDEKPLVGSESEVQVQLPLQPIAAILRENHITPTEDLPSPPSAGAETGVPPLT